MATVWPSNTLPASDRTASLRLACRLARVGTTCMPFSETPHGNAGEPSSSGERRESSTDYEGQRTERRRQEALTHLIETGRAKTPEEAEHYLDSLNRLRNKLLLFVQDLFAKRA